MNHPLRRPVELINPSNKHIWMEVIFHQPWYFLTNHILNFPKLQGSLKITIHFYCLNRPQIGSHWSWPLNLSCKSIDPFCPPSKPSRLQSSTASEFPLNSRTPEDRAASPSALIQKNRGEAMLGFQKRDPENWLLKISINHWVVISSPKKYCKFHQGHFWSTGLTDARLQSPTSNDGNPYSMGWFFERLRMENNGSF